MRGTLRRLGLRGGLYAARSLERVVRRLMAGVRRRVTPELAAELTAAAYARKAFYAERWHQDLGLFDFEAWALADHFPAPPASVLVVGCGAGRELLALRARGYRCAGLEPDRRLLEAARARLGEDVVLVQASAQELAADLALGGSLDAVDAVDAVIVGWAVWGHVLRREERVQALEALRARCPGGPVLLSWPHAPRRGLRGTAATTGAIARPPDRPAPDDWARRLVVSDDGAFSVRLDGDDVREEARAAGYARVDYRGPDDAGYPCAVLLPS